MFDLLFVCFSLNFSHLKRILQIIYIVLLILIQSLILCDYLLFYFILILRRKGVLFSLGSLIGVRYLFVPASVWGFPHSESWSVPEQTSFLAHIVFIASLGGRCICWSTHYTTSLIRFLARSPILTGVAIFLLELIYTIDIRQANFTSSSRFFITT